MNDTFCTKTRAIHFNNCFRGIQRLKGEYGEKWSDKLFDGMMAKLYKSEETGSGDPLSLLGPPTVLVETPDQTISSTARETEFKIKVFI